MEIEIIEIVCNSAIWVVGIVTFGKLFAMKHYLPKPQTPSSHNKAAEVATKREKYGSKVGVWVAAKGFIENRLNSPGSADYGWQTYDDCVTDLGDGEYRVKGWVDAQNGFGALERINFSLTVEYQGDSEWLVEELMYER